MKYLHLRASVTQPYRSLSLDIITTAFNNLDLYTQTLSLSPPLEAVLGAEKCAAAAGGIGPSRTRHGFVAPAAKDNRPYLHDLTLYIAVLSDVLNA